MPAGQATFDGSGATVDTSTTLATGAVETTTALNGAIDDVVTTVIFAAAHNADRTGGAVFIEDETILYTPSSVDSDYPMTLFDVIRGVDGTSAASHADTTSATIVGRQRYQNPAHVAATIEMQTTINDLLARVTALETP